MDVFNQFYLEIEDSDDEGVEIEEIYKKKRTYYEVLGIKKTATQKEITDAFRKKSRKCHPDVQRLTPEQKKIFKPKELEEYFEEKQKQLNEAYEVLSNERKRAQYDVLGKCITSLVLVDDSENVNFQELKERYKNYKREQRKIHRDTKTQGSSSATLGVDLAGMFLSEEESEQIVEEDGKTYRVIIPKVSFTNSSFSQSFQTPITKLDTVLFHGNANCDQLESENVAHTIAVQWRHVMDPTKESTQMDLATIYSSQNPTDLSIVASGSTKLSEFSQGSMQWVGQFNGVSPTVLNWLTVAGFQVVYKRQLFSDNTLSGSILFSFPRDNNVTFTLDKSFVHDGSSISSELRIGAASSHISCEFRRNLPEWLRNAIVRSKSEEEEDDIELVSDLTLSTTDFVSEYDLGFNMLLVKPVAEDTEIGFGVGASIQDGVNMKFNLRRFRHNFNVPIALTHIFDWKMLLFATITPIACFSLFKSFIFDPISSYWKKKDIKNQRKTAFLATQEKRQKALAELEKIREQALQSRNAEEEVNGLVIINAKFGDLEGDIDEGEYPSWIDLTDQLQFLVSNSKLYLPEYSKSRMEGSFDPAPGVSKTLLVWYRFNGKTHRVEVDDEEELRIPILEDVIDKTEGKAAASASSSDDEYESDE